MVIPHLTFVIPHFTCKEVFLGWDGASQQGLIRAAQVTFGFLSAEKSAGGKGRVVTGSLFLRCIVSARVGQVGERRWKERTDEMTREEGRQEWTGNGGGNMEGERLEKEKGEDGGERGEGTGGTGVAERGR